MKTVMAKGVNFLFARKYIENKYSAETWGRVMNKVSTGKTSDDLWETAYDLRWTE